MVPELSSAKNTSVPHALPHGNQAPLASTHSVDAPAAVALPDGLPEHVRVAASQRLDSGIQAFGERFGAATRATQHQLPKPEAFVALARKHARTTLPGMGLALLSSVAFAPLMGPLLAANVGSAAKLVSSAQLVPVVGGFVGLFAQNGLLGIAQASALFYTSTLALLAGDSQRERNLYWSLAHIAEGFALAPLWHIAATGTLGAAAPAALLGLGCGLALSTVLSEGSNRQNVSLAHGIAAFVLSLAGAPIGVLAAEGVQPAELALRLGLAIGLGAIAWGCNVWLNFFKEADSAGLAIIERCRVREIDSRVRLNLAGERAPTVFVDPDAYGDLFDIIGSIDANRSRGARFVQSPLLLSGVSGTGKSQITRALANHFGWPLFSVQGQLFEGEQPGGRVAELFRQAREFRDRRSTPIIVAFDEAESFFPSRAAEKDQGTTRAAARQAKTLAFNGEFEGLQASNNFDLLFIATTNHPEQLDPAILSRFQGSHIALRATSQPVANRIFAVQWREQHQFTEALRQRFSPFVPTADDMAHFERLCRAGGHVPTGRSIRGLVTKVLTMANRHFAAAAQQGAGQAAFDGFIRTHWQTSRLPTE